MSRHVLYSLVPIATVKASRTVTAAVAALLAGACAGAGGGASAVQEPDSRTAVQATPAAASPAAGGGMFAAPAPGAPPESHAPAAEGLVAFRQACADASADALVLNLAAHPDDEAARTLLVLRRRGLRTVTLYTTCGEGGQNAIGPEIGADLAAIRVQETLAASRRLGTEVRWLGMADFGFSRSLEETLRVWGEDELLRRMAAAVEAIDPDLVLTHHDLERGHGHHRASAYALHEVLRRRASATAMLATPLFERTTDEAVPTVVIDPSALDVWTGLTFARQAYDAYLEHRTQGPWRPHDPRSVRVDRWRRVDLAAPGRAVASGNGSTTVDDLLWPQALPSVFDEPAFAAAARAAGSDVGELRAALQAFAGVRERDAHVREARRLLPVLQAIAAELPVGATRAERRLQRRIDALQRVARIGSGVVIEAWPERDELPRGSEGTLWIAVHTAAGNAVSDVRVQVVGAGEQGGAAAAADAGAGAAERDASAGAAEGHASTGAAAGGASAGAAVPAHAFRVPFTFQPETAPPPGGLHVLRARVTMTLDGMPLAAEVPVDVREVAARDVAFDRPVLLLPAGAAGGERQVSLQVTWHGFDAQQASVDLTAPAGVRAECFPAALHLSPERNAQRVLVRLRIERAPERDARVRATWQGASADLIVRPVPLRLPEHLRVGIVRGTDDALECVLRDLGIEVVLLDEDRLALQDLSELTTVVLDVRAYQVREDLAAHRDRLQEFCRRGGRVVAFYHKPVEWNERPGRPALAPFPLVIGNGRVTEEDAPVTLLHEEHALLRVPNRITADDFAGWVQERGLYFAEKWDAAWTPLLRMHDTGTEPLDGALLYARCGAGDFVYCSLALWRQLREGHAGAVRLLVNLLSPSSGE